MAEYVINYIPDEAMDGVNKFNFRDVAQTQKILFMFWYLPWSSSSWIQEHMDPGIAETTLTISPVQVVIKAGKNP